MRARLRNIAKNVFIVSHRKMAGGAGGQGGDDLYSRCMRSSPILTSAVTAGFLWGSGDLIAQFIVEEATVDTVKRDRFVGTVVDGAAVGGVMSYYWYTGLERFVNWFKLIPGSTKFVAAKCALEIAVWHPFTLYLYWNIVGTFEGHSQVQIKKELKKDFFMTYLGDASLWTPLDILNFKIVPVQYQVLFVNLGSLIEAVALSYVHGTGGVFTETSDEICDPRSSVSARHWTFVENFFSKRSVEQIGKAAEEQFDELDTLKQGFLTLEQLTRSPFLPAIDDNAVRRKVMQLLRVKLEIDKSDKVSKSMYVRILKKLHEFKYRESFLADVIITIYDKNDDKKIDSSELEDILRLYIGMNPTNDLEIKSIMKKFDSDGSGKLDAGEIIFMLKDLGGRKK